MRSPCVSSAGKSNEHDFGLFVREHGPRLLRFAVAVAGPTAAEDLLQSALTNTFVKWHTVRGRDPAAYVRRAIVNGRTSTWRRSRRDVPLPDDYELADPADAYGQHDDRQRLMAALLLLPRQRRAVLALRYLDGLDDAAIAGVLRVRPSTVRSAAQRGLAQLRTILEPPAKNLGSEPTPTSRPPSGAHHGC